MKIAEKLLQKTALFTYFFVYLVTKSYCQEITEVKKTIQILCSDSLAGRGYTNSGVEKASFFLEKKFQEIGLLPFQKSYFQPFQHTINTFPKQNIHLQMNAQTPLVLGKDFIVEASSCSVKGSFNAVWLDTLIFSDAKAKSHFLKKNFKGHFLIYEKKVEKNLSKLSEQERATIFSSLAGIIEVHPKLTASVSTEQSKIPVFQVLKDKISHSTKKISCDLKALFLEQYTSKNVIGYLRGNQKPDSFLVVSAHYDHLGAMGNVYFPGANDNASGVSMVLELAKYYKKNPPKYSMVFMFFAGEEVGLLGSRFYVENPLFPLSQIKFLCNLDLVGTGDEGATIVNGAIFQKEFTLLEQLNAQKKLLPKIQKRGKAANSDHYFFSEKGVKAFFLYTLGGIKAYHDTDDKPETLPLTKYKQVFELLISFFDAVEKN